MSVRTLRYNTIEQHFTKGVTASTDRDALAFLEAAQIYNTNQQRAIVNLVRSLKRVGLWSKMKAIYPFVGGTATAHMYNLKDPRNADAAFRLVFYGGWTHSNTGATGNGSTAYADTLIIPATHLTQNSTHLSYYSRSSAEGQFVEIGYYNNSSAIMQVTNRYTGFGAISGSYSTANQVITSVSNGAYFAINSKTSSTSLKMYRNGSQIGTTNTTSDAQFTNLIDALSINARNDAGSRVLYSSRQCAFATIGDGLTDTDATNLYNIVDLYQKRLGRAV